MKVYEELKTFGSRGDTRLNALFQDNLARGKPNEWSCRAGSRYLYVDEEGLVHYCSQMRGVPGIPLEDYSRADLEREYGTKKACAPYCTINCVQRVAVLDNWRSPQTANARLVARPAPPRAAGRGAPRPPRRAARRRGLRSPRPRGPSSPAPPAGSERRSPAPWPPADGGSCSSRAAPTGWPVSPASWAGSAARRPARPRAPGSGRTSWRRSCPRRASTSTSWSTTPGSGHTGHFHEEPPDRLLAMVDLNVRAVVALTRALPARDGGAAAGARS